ncbi:hypothetical protein U1Q18_036410 [Sarracenia purpurea var. burkii]
MPRFAYCRRNLMATMIGLTEQAFMRASDREPLRTWGQVMMMAEYIVTNRLGGSQVDDEQACNQTNCTQRDREIATDIPTNAQSLPR